VYRRLDDDEEVVCVVVRRRPRASEPLALFATCAGVAGVLYGMSPRFLLSQLGVFLAGGAVLAAIVALVANHLDGRPLGRSLVWLLALGALIFAIGYLPLWLTWHYLPAHPEFYPKFPTPAR
jgi:hypothetical protein